MKYDEARPVKDKSMEAAFVAALMVYGPPPKYPNTKYSDTELVYWALRGQMDYEQKVAEFVYSRMDYTPRKSVSAELQAKHKRIRTIVALYNAWMRRHGQQRG